MGKRRLSTAIETDRKEIEGCSDDDQPIQARPINEIFKRSNKGKSERRYYEAVELDGVRYDLEDSVLVAPEQREEKPYVAIIKEIKQEKNGSVAITGQWFYRPEEAERKGGGSFTPIDSRELFYSFHRDEVPLESVMHACVVHFIPPMKEAPNRTKHPGFIIRHVYDAAEKRLWKLTDKDYEDSKQKEIDLLVQKTRDMLGDLPNIEPEELSNEAEDGEKLRRSLRRKTIPPVNVSRADSSETLAKCDAPLSAKVDTPSSCKSPGSGFPSEIMDLLRAQNLITGHTARDRWLEKIVMNLKYLFESEVKPGQKTVLAEVTHQQDDASSLQLNSDSLTNDGDGQQDDKGVGLGAAKWPESVIPVVSALEKVAYENLHGPDMLKYKQKMRQLDFNLKKSPVLARRLLTNELTASTVFNMTPVELKDGLTAAEKNTGEPPELETLQTIGALCTICGERIVGVKDIIQVRYGSKYKLECQKCGHDWYASRDYLSTVASLEVNDAPTVGLAPWATSKFEDVEKEQLLSPRESEKSLTAHDSFSSRHTKANEVDGTQMSHYEEVQRSLTEPISLSVSALGSQEHSKPNADLKAGSEKEENRIGDNSTQSHSIDHGPPNIIHEK